MQVSNYSIILSETLQANILFAVKYRDTVQGPCYRAVANQMSR